MPPTVMSPLDARLMVVCTPPLPRRRAVAVAVVSLVRPPTVIARIRIVLRALARRFVASLGDFGRPQFLVAVNGARPPPVSHV